MLTNRTTKVSVGMPVYNADQWIKPAVDSILNQTYQNIELIISDNASTDDTETICQEYANKDNRVKYYRNAVNIGANNNYNAVFRYSNSSYFKWASSNDIFHPQLLEKCVQVLDNDSNIVLCYPKARLFKQDINEGEDYEDKLNLMVEEPCQRFKNFVNGIRLNNIMNGVIRADILKKSRLIKNHFCSDHV